MNDRDIMKLALDALENLYDTCDWHGDDGREAMLNASKAIITIKEALAQPEQPEQEPVALRLPKAGDKVICLEDDSLATVVSLTAGGSPDIVFSDGSRGTYLLREFAELFGYVAPPQRKPLSDEEIRNLWDGHTVPVFGKNGINPIVFARAVEAAHGIKERNT
tara:strand:+ start:1253 stop:1741 length:489 start_codon:yes stop_codon:yes gene_type:complete